MPKIINPYTPAQDPLSILEAIDTSRRLLDQESRPHREQLIRRAVSINRLIETTTDPERLRHLHEWGTFLQQTARELDVRDILLDKVFRWLQRVDDSYWATMVQGEKIKEDAQVYMIGFDLMQSSVRKLLKRQRREEGAQA